MKQGTDRKVKFKLLQRDLGLARFEAIGLLQALWDFAQTNTPAGDIGRFSNEELAMDLEFSGDPDELIHALVNRRWLDENPVHRLIIHDWPEHCELSIHKKLATERRLFADGSVPSLSKIETAKRPEIERDYKRLLSQDICTEPAVEPSNSQGLPETPQVSQGLPETPLPYRTVPNQAVPIQAVPCRTEGRRGAVSVAAILQNGTEPSGRRRISAEYLVQISGDPPEALEEWRSMANAMRDNHALQILYDAVEYVQDCADAKIRVAKDLGPLNSPGAFIRKKCSNHLKSIGAAVPKMNKWKRSA